LSSALSSVAFADSEVPGATPPFRSQYSRSGFAVSSFKNHPDDPTNPNEAVESHQRSLRPQHSVSGDGAWHEFIRARLRQGSFTRFAAPGPLVPCDGSTDWLCFPRYYSAARFDPLL